MTVRNRRLPGWIAVLAVAAAAVACGGHAKQPPRSTLRAVAILTFEHPVNGKETVFHGPLAGYSVIAVNRAGGRFTAVIDHAGTAALSLPAGRYVVTTTDADACPPATVILTPAERRVVNLRCVAP